MRVLLMGACSAHGRALVEAFLALGARVVAADAFRTQLEELRAELRQHERLWVAECDPREPAAASALFADVARDEPIDAAVLVVTSGALLGAWEGDESELREALHALPRCLWFLRAALAHMAPRGRGRVLVLVEPSEHAVPTASAAAVRVLVEAAAERARPLGLSVCGLRTLGRDAVLRAADPALPALMGWQSGG
jgi:NAD(P)-dependent dehydrogenase (short-subunit alcohol dehydrogenase family)